MRYFMPERDLERKKKGRERCQMAILCSALAPIIDSFNLVNLDI